MTDAGNRFYHVTRRLEVPVSLNFQKNGRVVCMETKSPSSLTSIHAVAKVAQLQILMANRLFGEAEKLIIKIDQCRIEKDNCVRVYSQQ